MLQPIKCLKTDYWMSVERFRSNTVTAQQKHDHYVNVHMNPLDNPLTTCQIWMGWEMCIKLYLN